ncbi:MAG TPA: carbohydrate ABC transporter permease [Caldilineaceae bacterium]|nr:carbohydrate ABC transporter permease [Caldilineaceae bacterium]
MTTKSASMKAQTRLTNTLLYLILTVMAVVWLVPLVIIILTALRSQGDLIGNGVFAWPERIVWANFGRAWGIGNFSTYFRNSALLIVVKVPLGIILASLAAYPLAKMDFRFRTVIFIFFLLGLAIPVHVTLTPLLVMMKQLGIAGHLAALLPPYVVFGLPFQIFVMRGFFRTVPSELLEAARLDGASEWGIFWRILMPLSTPALATLFIIDALATWNELLIALVLISATEWRTVPVGLLQFQGQFSSRYTEMMAGVLISILPIIVLYIFLQRYMVSGLTAGALKE